MCLDSKDGELCLCRTKPETTLMKVRSGTDVQILRQSNHLVAGSCFLPKFQRMILEASKDLRGHKIQSGCLARETKIRTVKSPHRLCPRSLIAVGYKGRKSRGPPFRQLRFGNSGMSLSLASVRGLCWISMEGSRNAFGIFQPPLPLIQRGWSLQKHFAWHSAWSVWRQTV